MQHVFVLQTRLHFRISLNSPTNVSILSAFSRPGMKVIASDNAVCTGLCRTRRKFVTHFERKDAQDDSGWLNWLEDVRICLEFRGAKADSHYSLNNRSLHWLDWSSSTFAYLFLLHHSAVLEHTVDLQMDRQRRRDHDSHVKQWSHHSDLGMVKACRSQTVFFATKGVFNGLLDFKHRTGLRSPFVIQSDSESSEAGWSRAQGGMVERAIAKRLLHPGCRHIQWAHFLCLVCNSLAFRRLLGVCKS